MQEYSDKEVNVSQYFKSFPDEQLQFDLGFSPLRPYFSYKCHAYMCPYIKPFLNLLSFAQ
jgi:hypothetical protein